MVDLSSFGKIELSGPGALNLLQRLTVSDIDRPVGSAIYTQCCNAKGGIIADITITRLGDDRFLFVTGAGFIDNDLGHIKSNQRHDDLPVEIRNVTDAYSCFALWGPKSPDILKAATVDDISDAAIKYRQAKTITVNGVKTLAQRVSYAGEMGWEFYMEIEKAIMVWDRLWEAGQSYGVSAGGYKALDSLRLEKGYLYFSGDISTLDNPYEAGLGFTVNTNRDGEFIGRKALIAVKEAGIKRKMCTVVIGESDWLPLYGGEAVIAEDKVVTRLRSAGYGHTIKRNIGLAYLPLELAAEGTLLKVEIFGDSVSAQVAPRTLYDPKNVGLKG